MYFWWKPGPSPFWMCSIFCDYGTAVSELVAGLSDIPPPHVQWSRPAACICTICGHTEQPFAPAQWLLGPTLWNKCSQREKLLLGPKRTVWQNKTEPWIFRNLVCLTAWVDAEFHYPFKLLQICSKELSLVGRATQQEPACSHLTMALTAFRAAEISAPAKRCCLPASEIGEWEYSCRHLPTVIHPLLPPLQVKLWFSILNKTAKPACQSGSSLASLFPPPQDSTCSCAAAQGLEHKSRVHSATAWHWLLFEKLLGFGLLGESGWCSRGLAKLSRLALPRSAFQHILGFVTQTELYQGSLLLFSSRSLVVCSYPVFFSRNLILFYFC